MKKINFLLLVLILILLISNLVQKYHVYYIEEKISDKLKNIHIIYTNNEYCLEEPPNTSKNIINRIDMINDHLNLNNSEKPSCRWIKSVLLNAKEELIKN